ncbi:hypothetical protein [Gluconobacter wancherniae]|uniref:hypothetical protein n=1 Tax=Gluconobacter wancherniae TaxID=1307955 RepID=UPI001B8C7131|nr:hypothetical protein [Gluconobacter wancherniae]MBS1089847.1 hypothetical protein [Gluconobacter wancherniae]
MKNINKVYPAAGERRRGRIFLDVKRCNLLRQGLDMRKRRGGTLKPDGVIEESRIGFAFGGFRFFGELISDSWW